MLHSQSREAELQTRIQQLQDEIENNDAVAKLAGDAVEAEDARLRLELERLQAEHASSVQTVALLQSDIVDLEQRLKQATSDAAESHDLAQRLKSVEARLAEVTDSERKRTGDLDKQLANIEELERQIEDQTRMLDFAELEYETLLASSQAQYKTHETAMQELQERTNAISAKADKQREVMADSMEETKSTMLDERNKLLANISALELSLQESVESVQVSEERTAKLRSILNDREKEVQRLKVSMAGSGEPAEAVVLKLREEVIDLEARIDRRNRQIALEQEKARRLDLNLQLAQDTVEEQDAALQSSRQAVADAVAQIGLLRAQIDALESATSDLSVTIERMTDDAFRQQGQLEFLTRNHQEALQEATEIQTQLVLQLLLHRQHYSSITQTAYSNAQGLSRELSLANARIEELHVVQKERDTEQTTKLLSQAEFIKVTQGHNAALQDQVDALRVVLAWTTDSRRRAVDAANNHRLASMQAVKKHAGQVDALRETIEELRDRLRDLDSELVDAQEAKETAIREVEALDRRASRSQEELDQALEQLEQKEIELGTMQAMGRDQEGILDCELDKARAECTDLRRQVEILRAELCAAEKGYEDNRKVMEGSETVLVLAKEAAEAEITRRIMEHDRLQKEKEDAQSALAAAEMAMDRLQQLVTLAQSDLQQGIRQERQKLEETGSELASASAQVAQLRESLERAQMQNAQLEQDLAAAQEALASAETQKARIQCDFDSAGQQRAELERRLAELEDELLAQQEAKTALLTDREAAEAQLHAKTAEMSALQAALEGQRASTENIREESMALERTLGEAKRELEQERVQNHDRYVYRNIARHRSADS